MTTDHPELALDTDGIPILTELVEEDVLEKAVVGSTVEPPPPPSPRDIAREMLATETIRRQLDEVADDLAKNVRLHLEQNLAVAIDAAIQRTLDSTSSHTSDKIRRQLDGALAELVAKALQDSNRSS